MPREREAWQTGAHEPSPLWGEGRVKGKYSAALRTAHGADPHDGQASSLGRLALAPIRGDEWDAEIDRSLELESRRNVQRVQRPQP